MPKAPGASSCLTSACFWTETGMDIWDGYLTGSSYHIESPNNHFPGMAKGTWMYVYRPAFFIICNHGIEG